MIDLFLTLKSIGNQWLRNGITLLNSSHIYRVLLTKSIYIYKPLTRRGINASMLLRLLDGRFTCHEQARLGMVEANISKGPIHFNVNPDLTLSLDDGAPKKALTLKINTTGYQMIEDSRPLALVSRYTIIC